jgi:hypothetical protein
MICKGSTKERQEKESLACFSKLFRRQTERGHLAGSDDYIAALELMAFVNSAVRSDRIAQEKSGRRIKCPSGSESFLMHLPQFY